jgi:hypothetical protein
MSLLNTINLSLPCSAVLNKMDRSYFYFKKTHIPFYSLSSLSLWNIKSLLLNVFFRYYLFNEIIIFLIKKNEKK